LCGFPAGKTLFRRFPFPVRWPSPSPPEAKRPFRHGLIEGLVFSCRFGQICCAKGSRVFSTWRRKKVHPLTPKRLCEKSVHNHFGIRSEAMSVAPGRLTARVRTSTPGPLPQTRAGVGRPLRWSARTFIRPKRHRFGATRHPGSDLGFRAVQTNLQELGWPDSRPRHSIDQHAYGLIGQILLSDCARGIRCRRENLRRRFP
jgi:hypothetical protein